MEPEALRRLIRTKLADGRLPLNNLPNVCGGPGNGESCLACEDIVTKDEFVMEEISPANGKGPIQLHVGCFWMWETERQPLASALVQLGLPHGTPSPSLIAPAREAAAGTAARAWA